jgi:uncharacterized protein (DUF1684 family)
MSQLDAFRAAKDRFFKEHPQSPLSEEQRASFAGLRYFPEQPGLRMTLAVEPLAEGSTVVMQSSTGDTQEYRRLGRVRFAVDGQEAALTLFADEAGGLFLPFADALAGEETYGAGRYLEPEPLSDGRVLLDFNLAYNPYCAYNDDWSCPLTPPENRLAVAIRAGERLFHEEAGA